MIKRVFLGGPMHGKEVLLPAMSWTFQCFDEIQPMPRRAHTYWLRRYRVGWDALGCGGTAFDVFVYEPVGYWRAGAWLRRNYERGFAP